MTRVVVTGGAGFIGSEVVRLLAARGDEVIVVDNLVNGKRENLEGIPVHLEVADIRNSTRMRELIHGANVVFHLACLGVRHSIHSPRENHDVNATATLELLMAARDIGVSRFVHISTSEVYGTARWAPMTEEHPTFPMTVYGASKLVGECYARAFYETYRYPTVVVRPFNAYGPRSHHEGDSGEVIPKFLLRSLAGLPMVVFGDGTQTRDFTFVTDTARGIIAAGFSDAAVGQTLNIGSRSEVTINDLAEIIARVADRDVQIEHDVPRPGDVLRLIADTSRIESLCEYHPQVSLEDGLHRLKVWYSKSGRSPQELLASERVRNWEAP